MAVENCDECGFDGSCWTDDGAVAAIAGLPAPWSEAVSGLADDELGRRPIPAMWSIAEYCDHVREVLFGMRFMLDVAVADPGTDLGPAPEPRFDPVSRAVDVSKALAGLSHEAGELVCRLMAVDRPVWASTVTVEGVASDLHWIARHAVHDATHHLGDIERLRRSLGQPHAE